MFAYESGAFARGSGSSTSSQSFQSFTATWPQKHPYLLHRHYICYTGAVIAARKHLYLLHRRCICYTGIVF